MPTDPDFVIETLADGTALFHPRTTAAALAVQSGRYGAEFHGRLEVEPGPPRDWLCGVAFDYRDILREILERDGCRCVLVGDD